MRDVLQPRFSVIALANGETVDYAVQRNSDGAMAQGEDADGWPFTLRARCAVSAAIVLREIEQGRAHIVWWPQLSLRPDPAQERRDAINAAMINIDPLGNYDF